MVCSSSGRRVGCSCPITASTFCFRKPSSKIFTPRRNSSPMDRRSSKSGCSQSKMHRLAYFDFQELTVARQLAALVKAGATPRLIARKLAEIERRFPDVTRPLAELSLVLDGRSLLVRKGGELLEPGGQLRIDFDA